jgi:predicted metalloprotease with PDZ domain
VNPREVLRRCLAAVVLLSCGAALSATACATIRYEVSLAHPEQHLFHVTMRIPDVASDVTVQMPAWNALYQIRDFSAHVRQVEAFAGSEKASIEKVNKSAWRVHGRGGITLRYDTYWDEPGPFATQLNSDHAFINPAMILFYIPERREENVELTFGSSLPPGWRVAAQLRQEEDTLPSVYAASNYDRLGDAPIEAAKFEDFVIPEMFPPVRIVVHGDKWKREDIVDDLRRICRYQAGLMRDNGFGGYLFLLHVGKLADGSGGGMEHANSTAIFVQSEEDLPALAAHEFFHLWNVKRIRPATLEPVDYTKEQYTRALWFAEGVTNAYAAYTLVRTQLWSKEEFYRDFSQQVTDLEVRPAHRWQSAEQASLDTWLERYPIYNRPENSISYYAKGQVLGVLLDIMIRDHTNNEKSLDDVLRTMNAEFAQQNKPYRDSLDVRLTAEKVAGGSFEAFFQKYIANAEPLPYQNVLSLGGLELRMTEHKRPLLGFHAERDSAGILIVREIEPEGDAGAAGLRVGDAITGWNGVDPPGNPERWVSSQKPGNLLRLTVRREEKGLALELRIGEATERFYRLAEDSHASEKAKRIREGILHGSTQPVTAQNR